MHFNNWTWSCTQILISMTRVKTDNLMTKSGNKATVYWTPPLKDVKRGLFYSWSIMILFGGLAVDRVESDSNSSSVLLQPSVDKRSGCIHFWFALIWSDFLLFQSFETKTTESHIKLGNMTITGNRRMVLWKVARKADPCWAKQPWSCTVFVWQCVYVCVLLSIRRMEQVSVML